MEKEFEALIRKNQTKWLKLVNKFIHNPSDAEDVLQETMLTAYKNLEKYDPTRAGMNTWFHKIMFNQIHRWYNKNVKYQKSFSIEFWDELIDNSSLIEERCSFFSMIKDVDNQLDRTILMLTYIYGYTTREISSMLEVSLGKISNTTTKFRQQLKEN